MRPGRRGAQALCSASAKMCVRELRTEDPSVSVFYLALVSSIAATIGVSLPASLVTPPAGMSLLGWVNPSWREAAMLVGVGAPQAPRGRAHRALASPPGRRWMPRTVAESGARAQA